MLIPKKHIDSLSGVSADDVPLLGRMLAMTGRLARDQGSPEGFRTIINTGRVGRQEVMHLHIHVVGGAQQLGRMLPARN